MITSAECTGLITCGTPGPRKLGVRAREGCPKFLSLVPNCIPFLASEPNCLPSTPTRPGDRCGCGQHCHLITDLRAKLIFSSDKDVPLKNDFNPYKAARLPQAVQQTNDLSGFKDLPQGRCFWAGLVEIANGLPIEAEVFLVLCSYWAYFASIKETSLPASPAAPLALSIGPLLFPRILCEAKI